MGVVAGVGCTEGAGSVTVAVICPFGVVVTGSSVAVNVGVAKTEVPEVVSSGRDTVRVVVVPVVVEDRPHRTSGHTLQPERHIEHTDS